MDRPPSWALEESYQTGAFRAPYREASLDDHREGLVGAFAYEALVLDSYETRGPSYPTSCSWAEVGDEE